MARVTVEDCVMKIPNRFELVMTAAQRARDVAAGADLTLERDNDKNPVVALREIAEENVDFAALEETLVTSLQRYIQSDDPVEDEMDVRALQLDVSGEDAGDANEAEEVAEDELTVHDVAAEEVEAAIKDAEAMMEGGEVGEQ